MLRRLGRYFEGGVPGWLKWVLTGVIVLAIALNVDAEAMLEAVRRADAKPAVLALALVVPNYLLAGLGWWFIARRIEPQTSYSECLRAVIGSLAIGFWTPARLGEFAGRGWMHGRGSPWAWASGVGLEAFLKYGPPLLLGPIALLLLAPAPVAFWTALGVASLVLFAGVLGAALHPARVHGWIVRRTERPALAFLGRMRPADTASILGITAVRLLIGATQLALLARSFGADPSFPLLLTAGVATLSLKNVFPNLTVGDLGVREASSVLFFGTLAVPSAIALDAALGLYAFNILLPTAIGAVVMAWPGPRTSPGT